MRGWSTSGMTAVNPSGDIRSSTPVLWLSLNLTHSPQFSADLISLEKLSCICDSISSSMVICEGTSSTFGRLATMMSRLLTSSSSNTCSSFSSLTSSFFRIHGWGVLTDRQDITVSSCSVV
eukprot:IDg23235t1